jgi:hypothetical protein
MSSRKALSSSHSSSARKSSSLKPSSRFSYFFAREASNLFSAFFEAVSLGGRFYRPESTYTQKGLSGECDSRS